MPKKHGPDFKKAPIEVQRCRSCRAKGVVQGVFYELPCEDCKGVGWVAAGGAAVTMEQLAYALGKRVDHAEHQLAQHLIKTPAGTEPVYHTENRRGPGGSRYVGD